MVNSFSISHKKYYFQQNYGKLGINWYIFESISECINTIPNFILHNKVTALIVLMAGLQN